MRRLFIISLLSAFLSVNAQTMLTVEEAVNIALKNNYGILIARNNADIARINNAAGNAGMLPVIEIAGSGAFQTNNVYQKFSGGNTNEYNPLNTSSLNIGPQLSWTLYDGGRMFVTKNRLKEIEALGEIEFKDKVTQTLYNVIAGYYEVVRQKKQLSSINDVLELSRERVKIAQAGFDAGSLLKTDLLQAKIDLNVTAASAVSQGFVIETAKKELSVLLGFNEDVSFDVADSIPSDYTPDKAFLLSSLDSSNTSILSFQKQLEIARLNLKESNKQFLPTFKLNSGYYFSLTSNSEGSLIKNRETGPQINGSLSIPIFNAGNSKRNAETAKLLLKSAESELQNIRLEKHKELLNAIKGFEIQQKLLSLEKENNNLSKENFDISLQRLRLGQTTSLEVHQAQESYLQSCTRLINYEYNLKIQEIKLKQLVASF